MYTEAVGRKPDKCFGVRSKNKRLTLWYYDDLKYPVILEMKRLGVKDMGEPRVVKTTIALSRMAVFSIVDLLGKLVKEVPDFFNKIPEEES